MGRGGEVREQFFVPIFTFTADVCNIKQYHTYNLHMKPGIPMYKHTESRRSTGCGCCVA